MIINHNMQAINAHRQMGANQTATAKSTEKLSSGLRINRAGDDAAGLAISEKMRAQIAGLDQATRNAQDGISLIQTAEGALNETHSILQRMRELAVQSSNDTNTDTDRAELQKEIDQLSQEVTRIAENTQFNEQNLLDGSFEGTFHIGANADQDINISISNIDAGTLGIDGTIATEIEAGDIVLTNRNTGATYSLTITQETATTAIKEVEMSATAAADGAITVKLGATYDAGTKGSKATSTVADVVKAINELGLEGLMVSLKDGVETTTIATATAAATVGTATPSEEGKGIDISSQSAASDAITTIDSAIKTISGNRSNLGAVQNRLEHTINNLGTSSENLTAAESRIRDVDMAKEMMEFTKNNVLSQASQAMLAQAKALPNQVLSLLQ